MTSISSISSSTPAVQTSAASAKSREAAKAQDTKKAQAGIEDMLEISPAAKEAYGQK